MKRFDFGLTLILSIVTCSIYQLYMWYTMGESQNEIARENGLSEIPSFIVAFLLSMVTCGIYGYYWMYKFYEQEVALASTRNRKLMVSDNPIILLLISFVPFYSFYVLCNNYNSVLDTYGK